MLRNEEHARENSVRVGRAPVAPVVSGQIVGPAVGRRPEQGRADSSNLAAALTRKTLACLLVFMIEHLVATIQRMKQANQFKSYIDFIEFPKYRNIRPGTRISFGFPLTVLVGRNGTGKSSVLLALHGAPRDYSVGNWWFGTAVDPIDEESKPVSSSTGERKRTALSHSERSAFWYGYSVAGEHREVLKSRIRRPADPDYWEPSRPVAKYGMTLLADEKRSPAIEMAVTYINFKHQPHAFDRCFIRSPKLR
jgi:hypothetical protein